MSKEVLTKDAELTNLTTVQERGPFKQQGFLALGAAKASLIMK
jgi:hypothetical protein